MNIEARDLKVGMTVVNGYTGKRITKISKIEEESGRIKIYTGNGAKQKLENASGKAVPYILISE